MASRNYLRNALLVEVQNREAVALRRRCVPEDTTSCLTAALVRVLIEAVTFAAFVRYDQI